MINDIPYRAISDTIWWNEPLLSTNISNSYFRINELRISCSLLTVTTESSSTHYNIVCQDYHDIWMGAKASQITSLTIVYSSVYSGTDKRKHQSSASLAFVRGIHWTIEFPAKRASNAENDSIWWRHHGFTIYHFEIHISLFLLRFVTVKFHSDFTALWKQVTQVNHSTSHNSPCWYTCGICKR